MPTERLPSLRRQRALVASHLAWLDTEIAALAPLDAASTSTMPSVLDGAAPPPDANPIPGAPGPTNFPVAPADNLAAANARADEILARYATTGRTDPAEARKGCLLLTLVVFCLGWLAVLAIYFLRYRTVTP